MDENQIKQLVEGVKQGVQASFEMLYMVSSRAVYFICASFLGDEEDAKDVVQEVYATAYEKIYQLNDGGKFVPWINQIAVNKCKKVLLKKAPSFVDVEDMDSRLPEENENFLPEEYITQKEKRKLVMDIMRNSLSDIQYKTVILYYFNRLTIDEIADIMECPPGTVKYRLSVARAKIRDGVQVYENRNNDKLYSVVGVGAFVLINNNKSDKALDEEATFDTVEQSLSTEMTDTEEITEETEKTTTEEQKVTQSLKVIELKKYSENNDGEDGHLYSYYTDSGLGYKIYDFGKPSWDVSDIDIISSDIDSSGDFMLIAKMKSLIP